MMPAIVAATAGVDARDAGVASGLLNMSRQLGAAVGLAALVTVAAGATDHASGPGTAAVVAGYRVAFDVMAGIGVASAALALRLEGPRRGTSGSSTRS